MGDSLGQMLGQSVHAMPRQWEKVMEARSIQQIKLSFFQKQTHQKAGVQVFKPLVLWSLINHQPETLPETIA